jgi:hypothetical protein
MLRRQGDKILRGQDVSDECDGKPLKINCLLVGNSRNKLYSVQSLPRFYFMAIEP